MHQSPFCSLYVMPVCAFEAFCVITAFAPPLTAVCLSSQFFTFSLFFLPAGLSLLPVTNSLTLPFFTIASSYTINISTTPCLSSHSSSYPHLPTPTSAPLYRFPLPRPARTSPSPLSSSLSPSYDLLGEEDPDEFVSVDLPEDLKASDVAVLPPPSG